MHPATALDIAFLAPGLVHQFGNLLLTIQGHSLHLEAETAAVARSQPAIRNACDRGAASLRILRHLLGDAGPERAAAGEAVGQLAELLRIPVREAGHSLECAGPDGRDAAVIELASFVPLAVALVRALVTAVPDGVRGNVRLSLQGGPPVVLAACFQPAAGSLPFPLATDQALRALRTEVARRGFRLQVGSRPDGITVQWPPATGVLEA